MEFKLEVYHRDISNEDLIKDLQKVHSSLQSSSKKLTFRIYNEFGKFSGQTIAERFGSWNRALQEAGIMLTQERSVSIDELFDNMRAVWIAKGKQPVFRDMGQKTSQYAASTYADRFGGWRNALIEFLKWVATEQEVSLTSTQVATPKKLSINKKRTSRDPTLRMQFRVMRRDDFKCVKCGRSPATEPKLRLEIDHILAWSNGGETVEENLQTLCYDCNRGKGNSNDIRTA
jgi:Homing endonuclease associated repeat/HNH endonuclease